MFGFVYDERSLTIFNLFPQTCNFKPLYPPELVHNLTTCQPGHMVIKPLRPRVTNLWTNDIKFSHYARNMLETLLPDSDSAFYNSRH